MSSKPINPNTFNPHVANPDRSIVRQPTQTCAAHMGISAINSFSTQVSASRNMMNANQITNKITLLNPGRKHLSSGFATDSSKYVIDIKTPCDLVVVKVYESGRGETAKKVIMYQETDTETLGMIEIPSYITYKSVYGFDYIHTDALKEVRVGSRLPKGLVLASTSSTKYGSYDYGANLNLCIISMEETGEDGIILNEECLDKLAYYTYKTITLKVDTNAVLLDLYSEEDDPRYLPLPEVGDALRPDGIIAVARVMRGLYGEDSKPNIVKDKVTIDSTLMIPALGTRRKLRTIDYHTDKKYQRQDGSEGIVVDIDIIRGFNSKGENKKDTSTNDFSGWADSIDLAAERSNSDRMAIYRDYLAHCRNYHLDIDKVNITEQLSNVLMKTIALNIHHGKRRAVPNMRLGELTTPLKLIIKKEKLPSYLITVTVRTRCVPQLGGKLTDLFSAKGVITAIKPKVNMPVDINGRYTDIACSIEATTNRSIVGRQSDMYISDACLTLTDKIKIMMGIPKSPTERMVSRAIAQTNVNNPQLVDEIFDLLTGLYMIINEKQGEAIQQIREALPRDSTGRMRRILDDHLYMAIYEGVSVVLPVEVLTRLGNVDVHGIRDQGLDWFKNRGSVGIINTIEKSIYRPTYERVSYVNSKGVRVSPKYPVRIAPIYYIVLDKTATDYSVANTTYLQSHNLSATIPSADRQFHSVNANTVRCLGPDETIIASGLMTSLQMIELYDRHNNAEAIKNLIYNIYNRDKPAGQNNLVNRTTVPYGQTAGLELSRHVLAANGVELVYKPSSMTRPKRG